MIDLYKFADRNILIKLFLKELLLKMDGWIYRYEVEADFAI